MFIFIGGVLYSLDPPNAYLWGGPDPPTPPGIDVPAGGKRKNLPFLSGMDMTNFVFVFITLFSIFSKTGLYVEVFIV